MAWRLGAMPPLQFFSHGYSAAMPSSFYMRFRKVCLSLPETQETMTWGAPHFRIGEKIFAGCGEDKGGTFGFKCEWDTFDKLIESGLFTPAPYVGKHGWVQGQMDNPPPWKELEPLIKKSHELISKGKTKAGKTKAAKGRATKRNKP
jgi:predicted DNA-binding protein (MmcQ/YjbR family)